jgi:hypothetical protein
MLGGAACQISNGPAYSRLQVQAVQPSRAPLALAGAEAKRASHIGAVEAFKLAAGHLWVSLATAQTRLKAVFAKTNTHRQGELVAPIARLRSFQRQQVDTSFGDADAYGQEHPRYDGAV